MKILSLESEVSTNSTNQTWQSKISSFISMEGFKREVFKVYTSIKLINNHFHCKIVQMLRHTDHITIEILGIIKSFVTMLFHALPKKREEVLLSNLSCRPKCWIESTIKLEWGSTIASLNKLLFDHWDGLDMTTPSSKTVHETGIDGWFAHGIQSKST